MILRQLWRISSPGNPGNRLNTGCLLPHRVQMRMLNALPGNQVDPGAPLPTDEICHVDERCPYRPIADEDIDVAARLVITTHGGPEDPDGADM